MASLCELHAKAVAANAIHEEAKRKARETTDAFLPLNLALNRATSGTFDMAIGAVGKGTVAAKNSSAPGASSSGRRRRGSSRR